MNVFILQSNFNNIRFNLGPTAAEPRDEAKSVAPVKPVLHTIPLFKPTQKPGKIDYIDFDIRIIFRISRINEIL